MAMPDTHKMDCIVNRGGSNQALQAIKAVTNDQVGRHLQVHVVGGYCVE